MKVTALVLALALCSETALAAWGLSKAIYNKWHETELERWLSDHNVPYPTAADRKDLEKLVKENWEGYVVSPYEKWDTKQQVDWLSQKGVDVTDKQVENADWLKKQVQKKWYETESSLRKDMETRSLGFLTLGLILNSSHSLTTTTSLAQSHDLVMLSWLPLVATMLLSLKRPEKPPLIQATGYTRTGLTAT